MQSIEDNIQEIIAMQFSISTKEIRPEASFVDDLGIGSLDAIQIIMAVEEEFEIEIPDEDADQMVRVKDLVEYVENKLKNRIG